MAKGKSEIVATPNNYKNTLDNLINISDTESPDQSDSPDRPRLIDKGSHNALKSKIGLPTLSEKDRLDENVPVTSLEPAPKIWVSQVHQRHDIAPLSPKGKRAQYGNSQRDEEDKKCKKGWENGKSERGRRGHWMNKVDQVVEESGGSETSDYYHIIY